MPQAAKTPFAILLLALGLAACEPIYETRYNLTPPGSVEGRTCTNSCQQVRQLCMQNVTLQEQSCVSDARAQASVEYFAYVQRQLANNQPVLRDMKSFMDTGACPMPNQRASCEHEYLSCYASCGGTVTPITVCTAFCD